MIKTKLFKGEWIKTKDWIDNSPRYYIYVQDVFEENEPRWCDTYDSCMRFTVIIVTNKEWSRYDNKYIKIYEASIYDGRQEAQSSNKFKNVKDARLWAEKEVLRILKLSDIEYNTDFMQRLELL